MLIQITRSDGTIITINPNHIIALQAANGPDSAEYTEVVLSSGQSFKALGSVLDLTNQINNHEAA